MRHVSNVWWSIKFHLIHCPIRKKCLVISLVYRVLRSFRQWPLVPFLFLSNVNILSTLTRDNPLNALKSSIQFKEFNTQPSLCLHDWPFVDICYNIILHYITLTLAYCRLYTLLNHYYDSVNLLLAYNASSSSSSNILLIVWHTANKC